MQRIPQLQLLNSFLHIPLRQTIPTLLFKHTPTHISSLLFLTYFFLNTNPSVSIAYIWLLFFIVLKHFF